MIKSVKGMEISNNIKINYETFDYLDEIIKTNRERPHRHSKDSITEKYNINWVGVRNYEEAEEMAIHGWKEQDDNKDIEKIFNLQDTKDEEKLVTLKNDVVGYAPVIPLVLQGLPNSMINVVKKRVKSKILHIVYNISTCAGTNPHDILEAGLKLFKVIMKLERQGYRVRLTAMQDFSGNNANRSADFMILNLKSEYKPLDISNTMFPLLHPRYV